MSTTPAKKAKTAPAQSATLLNFFRPKPSAKEISATSAPPRSTSPFFASSSSSSSSSLSSCSELSSSSVGSFRSCSSSCAPSREERIDAVFGESDDPVGPDLVRDDSFSFSHVPPARPLSKPLVSKPLSDEPSPYASSASSSSWDALPPIAPKSTPYASAASSSSWDSLPKSSSSFAAASKTSSSFSSKPSSYPKVTPSYAPPISSSSLSSASKTDEKAAPNRYVAEIAKSGRSTCRDFKCKQKIEKSELRIGKMTPNYFHEGSDDVMTQWFHPPCIFSALARAKQSTKKIERVEDIENFEGLSEMHQNWIRDLLVQTAGTISKPPPSIKTKSSAPSYSSSSSSSSSGSSGSSSSSSSSNGSDGATWEFNKDGGWFLMAPEDSKMLEDHYSKADYHFMTKDISFNKVYQTLYAFHLNGADPTQVNTVSGTATHLRRVVPKPPPFVKAKSAIKTTSSCTVSSAGDVSTGWEWFNKDRWTPFAAEDALMLESRFQNDEFVFETKKLSFNLAHGTTYKFVLNGSKPTQTNRSTGTLTPIRRVAPPSSTAEEEEDWWGDDDDSSAAAVTAEPEEDEEEDTGAADVWWEWSNMGSWDKFLPKDSKMLESKWKNGELIFCHIISYGGREHEMYKFNLKGPNPTQRNTETGLTRSLRRRKAGVEPTPSKPKEESDHCWHWYNKETEQWTHFMAADSKMLEERFVSGDLSFETKDLSFNKGFPTVYRFNLGSTPTQKNLTTSSVTSLRRAPLPKKEAPSSPPPSMSSKKKSSPMKTKFSGGEKQVKKSEAHWEWNKGGTWFPFENSDSHMIEARYLGKDFVFVTSKLSFNAGFSTEYKFILNGESPTQTNMKTGVTTPLRRVGSSASTSKIDDDWWS